MGMDVYGRKPTGPRGRYFRRNIWGWHPLATLCCDLAPAECAPCRDWHVNEGFGLSATESIRLAHRLHALVCDGTVAAYIAKHTEPGTRTITVGTLEEFLSQLADPPFELEIEDVAEFIAFLRECGGFEIF